MKEYPIAPIVGLWAGVIIKAICDIEEGHKIAYRMQRKVTRNARATARDDLYKVYSEGAAEWLESDSMEPASFLWICEMCDFDARKIRLMSETREGRKRLSRTTTFRKGQKLPKPRSKKEAEGDDEDAAED